MACRCLLPLYILSDSSFLLVYVFVGLVGCLLMLLDVIVCRLMLSFLSFVVCRCCSLLSVDVVVVRCCCLLLMFVVVGVVYVA